MQPMLRGMTPPQPKLVSFPVCLLIAVSTIQPALGAHKPDACERLVRDAVKLLAADSRPPLDRFVFVHDIERQFPDAEEIEKQAIRESVMFTYSRDSAGFIYVNTSDVFFDYADAADREYGSRSGFRYALAAKIAHELCHLGQPKETRLEVPCYQTELRVFHEFVARGYLNHAREWAVETEESLRETIHQRENTAQEPIPAITQRK